MRTRCAHNSTFIMTALTADDFLALGLDRAGIRQWRNRNATRNIADFKGRFGCTPLGASLMWADMLVSGNPQCRIGVDANPLHLLIATRLLSKYETERDLAGFFGYNDRATVRHWAQVYTNKIHLLLAGKMGSLEEAAADGLMYALTLDGTQCPANEFRPFTKDNFAHKFNCCGVNYELGVMLHKPKLCWIHGPTQPGAANDLTVFESRLMGEMEARIPGRRAIADGIYAPAAGYISTQNDLDPPEVAKFKDRALSRHEKFNGLLKNYDILTKKFRHGRENHRVAFEAVCAVVHYELECGGCSLFDPYP